MICKFVRRSRFQASLFEGEGDVACPSNPLTKDIALGDAFWLAFGVAFFSFCVLCSLGGAPIIPSSLKQILQKTSLLSPLGGPFGTFQMLK